MYNNYRAYESSWSTRNGRAPTASTTSTTVVRENGTMGRHTSASPPPITIGDGKRRPIRDRLQNITTAMAWIKEELVSVHLGGGQEREGRHREREKERGFHCLYWPSVVRSQVHYCRVFFCGANVPPPRVVCGVRHDQADMKR